MAEKDFDIVLFYSLKAGNDDALELLFNKYYSNLCHYVQTIVNDSVLSEDIVTDLFADFWVKRSKLEITQNFRGYIYASARNASLAYLRKKKLDTVSLEDYTDIDVAESQTPFSKFDKELTDLNIEFILRQIPPRSRQVFVLQRFEEMKYKEISKFLSISIKTVESHMSKALKILHKNKDLLKKILYLLLLFTLDSY